MGLMGRRILVVEDEALIALMLQDMLHELGCHVVGVVCRLADAVSIIEDSAIDAVTLDINLGGESGHEIAAFLRGRGIPFVVSTGYTDPANLAGLEKHPMVHKPFATGDLERALRSLAFRD